MTLKDKTKGLLLLATALTAFSAIYQTPARADGNPPPGQNQECNLGGTTITVGDVVTASDIAHTEEGQDLMDMADVTVTPPAPDVPEPGTLAIFGAGLIALRLLRRQAIRDQA